VRDTLAPGPVARAGFLSSEAVQALVDDHETQRADHAWGVWSLLVLQRWFERWAQPAAGSTERLFKPGVAA